MRRATILSLLLLCMVAGCKDGAIVMPWSPAARFNTREWILARERGAVTVSGPTKPKLLWEWKEPQDMSIDAVLPMPDGTTFVGCSRERNADPKIRALHRKPASELSKQDIRLLVDSLFRKDTDGGNDGFIIKLDQAGHELARIQLADTADKQGWSYFGFSAYPATNGFVVAAGARTYEAKRKARDKRLQLDEEAWFKGKGPEPKGNDYSEVGLREIKVAAWDTDLKPLWTRDMPDAIFNGVSQLAVDTQGNTMLDYRVVADDPSAFPFHSFLTWIGRAGKDVAKFEFPIDLEHPAANAPAIPGYDGRGIAENKGYLYAGEDGHIWSFDAQQRYQAVIDLKRDIFHQPVPKASSGWVVAACRYPRVEDSETKYKNRAKEDAVQLRELTTRGDDAGALEPTGWEGNRGAEFCLGRDDSLYYFTITGKNPGEKEAIEKKLHARWKLTGKALEKAKSVPLHWTAVAVLKRVNAAGLLLWEYRHEFPVEDLGPMLGNPLLDKNGNCYLLGEDKFIGVDANGKRMFALGLKPGQFEPIALLGVNNPQIGPDGNLYLAGSNGLAVYGD